MSRYLFALAALLIVFTAHTAHAKTNIVVSVVPQKYLVDSIGGDLVSSSVMVAPGASPATYEPKPKQMVSLSNAQIYFSIGVPFEKAWLPRLRSANSNMQVIPMHKGIELLPMAAHSHGEHSGDEDHHEAHDEDHGHHDAQKHMDHEKHEDHAEHEHHAEKNEHHAEHEHHADKNEHHDDHHAEHGRMMDPHVWTSPALMRIMAATTLNALIQADPKNAVTYRRNFTETILRINQTDSAVATAFSGLGEEPMFMIFHPAFGYFAAAYGLKQVAIETEGKEPSPRQLAELTEFARAHKVRVLFVEPQFSRKSAEVIARSIGAKVLVADPLAEDWSANMKRIAGEMRRAME